MAQVGTSGLVGYSDWQPPRAHGLGQVAKAAAVAIVASGVIYGGGVLMWRAHQAGKAEQARRVSEAYVTLISSPALPMLPLDRTAHGRDLFLMTCAACHGPDARGMPGLGKDLTTSNVVASMNDKDLAAMVKAGRPAARPLPMPPKGGNESLTDGDIADIVLYLRGVQDPRRLPELPPPTLVAGAPSDEDKAKALAAAGGDEELAAYIAHGSRVFAMTCSACHGKDARGVPGNGKDLINSEFCRTSDDETMLAFLKRGRDPSDPANTTGVGMPPRGGNPALSDDDLLDVIEYLRSLRKSAGVQ